MGLNAEAIENTVAALEGLTPEHDALVAHARTLARLLDEYPTEAKLHGEYRQVMIKLLELGKKPETDAFERLLKELRGEAAQSSIKT